MTATNTMLVGGNSTNLDIFGNTTFFSGAGGRANAVGIEQTLQTAAPAAFTAQFMGVQIHSSTSGAAVTHWRFRNASVTGNQDCNLTGSVTGWIQDTTHTDSVSNGALYNYAFVGTSGGPDILFAANSMVINNTSPLATSIWTALSPVSGSAESISGSSVVFLPPGGGSAIQAGGETTETTATKTTMRAAGAYSGFCVTTCSGIGATTAVARFRVNGANGNQTFTLPPSTTIKDTTHTDSVAAGDLINTGFTPNSTTTNFASLGVSMAGTKSAQDVTCGQTNQSSSATNFDTFMALGGQYGQTTNEADCKIITGYAFTASRERVKVNTNTLSVATSVKFRKAGADGNQVASISSATTGVIEDTTHTDSVTSSNSVNHRFASNGGTGTAVFDWLAVTADDGSNIGSSTETGVGLMTFNGISFNAHALDYERATGLMSFNGISFTGTALDQEHGVGIMSFNGIGFNSNALVYERATGLMSFNGVSFVGTSSRKETGTGVLTFTGISYNGLARVTHIRGVGLMSFAGVTFHAGGFIPAPAGTGLRQFWTT